MQNTILEPPYSAKEKRKFEQTAASEGLHTEEYDYTIYALLPSQHLEDGEIVTDTTFAAKELAKAKAEKQAENQRKLDAARTSHEFTVTLQGQTCEFDTKDKTQSDLNSAAISAGAGQPWLWTTNNLVTLSLTSEDIQTVSAAYMQAVNEDIRKWAAFEVQIDSAQNLETLQTLEIAY